MRHPSASDAGGRECLCLGSSSQRVVEHRQPRIVAASGVAGWYSSLTRATPPDEMRICLVYDCLFPTPSAARSAGTATSGERLAGDGHEVTYLTLRQWDRGAAAEVPGVDVVAVGPRMGALQGNGTAHPASTRLRRRRAGAPAPPRPPATTWSTRPRSPTSRCLRRDRAPARALPAGSRLARGVVPRILAGLPRRGRRARRLGGPAALRPGAAHGVLLLEAARRAPGASRASAAGSRCSRASTRARSSRRRSGRRPSRSSSSRAGTSPRSAYRHSSRRSSAPTHGTAGLRCEIYGDGPERAAGARARARARPRGRAWRHRASSTRSAWTPHCGRALCMVLPSSREGYGLVVRRGLRPRHAEHRGGGPGQRRGRARRGGPQRLRRPVGGSRPARRRDHAGASRAGPALRSDDRRLV